MFYVAKPQPGERRTPPTPISQARQGALPVPGCGRAGQPRGHWAAWDVPRTPFSCRAINGRAGHPTLHQVPLSSMKAPWSMPMAQSILSQMHSTLITCNSCRNKPLRWRKPSVPPSLVSSLQSVCQIGPSLFKIKAQGSRDCRTSTSLKYRTSTCL